MYTTKPASSNSIVFYQYDIRSTSQVFKADSTFPKRFVISENDILKNSTLFQGIILYLSPSQLARLPASIKANQLFMNYLKLSSLAIQPEDLPLNDPIEEKREHVFDGEQAFALLQHLAKQKFAPALRAMAACYLEGSGVERNLDESLKLYREAGDQDFAPALYYLGHITEHGKAGVKQDFAKAVRLYREAADKGLALAQECMSYCLFKGIGVPQNMQESVKYTKVAADQGLATSQQHLAYRLETGQGIPKNIPAALKYYKLAADEGGLPQSQHNLAVLLEHEEDFRDMEEAIKYYRLAAAQNLPQAKRRLEALEARKSEPSFDFQKKLDQALKKQADMFEEKLKFKDEIHHQQVRELKQKLRVLNQQLEELKEKQMKQDNA